MVKQHNARNSRDSRQAGKKLIASNRRARHDYEVLETLECGMVLKGSEVKSLRTAKVQIADAFARIDDDEIWLHDLHIAPYAQTATFGHDPERPRKLLAHRDEIDHLRARVEQERLTLIPLSLYFKDGRAKVELALARGRKRYDKRHAIATRDAEREVQRELGRSLKRGLDRR
ncbi:MAG: SsrA-binding protein SmpB [Acidimicrobiales bacterium]|nr:SsrA-binding protein SmpB [Acidimicrobiales bacterium]